MRGDFRIPMFLAFLTPLAIGVAGCTYERLGEPELHFSEFESAPPRGNVVTVCHAYGCQMQTKVAIPESELAAVAALMRRTKRRNTPFEERRAVAYAVAAIERYIGEVVGTRTDRPGMDYRGSGDPTQMDCVDKSTNLTSYMLVLQANKLMKYHTVGIPIAKGNPLQGFSGWPHWTAILKETATGQRFAVDSWSFANGENPAVVEIEKWYINDLEHLPPSLT
jgi:hypothetical protein